MDEKRVKRKEVSAPSTSKGGAGSRQLHLNWAGNTAFTAEEIDQAENAREVQRLVKARSHVKALGTRHSFNAIADTTGVQIAPGNDPPLLLDPDADTVTVGAGITYGALARWIDERGFALHNLASLPHISVGGACATATHGSGLHNGNLSTAVLGIEFVDGRGEVVALTRASNRGLFEGTVVGLGALGVMTRLALHVVPRYEVAQAVYEELPFEALEQHCDEVFAAAYSVSVFTDWQRHRGTQFWLKKKVEGEAAQFPAELFGARLQKTKLHPLPGHSAENCTEQQGIPGPWYERLPHFRMKFVPSSGAELQSEYFVPRSCAAQALRAVEELRDRITPHLFVSELRTVAADDLWMSMAFERDSLGIHFTWKPEWEAVRQILPAIEEQLAPFEARPHWAKLFTMSRTRLRELYPKFEEFRALARRYDPKGKFRNAFLDQYVLGE